MLGKGEVMSAGKNKQTKHSKKMTQQKQTTTTTTTESSTQTVLLPAELQQDNNYEISKPNKWGELYFFTFAFTQPL